LAQVRQVIDVLDKPSAQRTELVRLRYLKPDNAMQLLPASLPQQSVKPVTLLNALLVSGTDETINAFKREITGLDQPAPQVAIEVMLTEVSANAARQLSGQVQGSLTHLKAALPGGMIVYQTQEGMRDLVVGLTALIEKGEAKLLATPRLTTVNGTPARMDIVTERYFRIGFPVTTTQPGGGQTVVPFFPQVDLKQIRAGIQLSVTPLVGQDGAIMLEVEPTVSAITGVVADGLPEISSRSAKVSVRVRDGQTLAIGGLRQREDTKTLQKTPLLGDIPLIGSLFRRATKSERESELLIFLTPKVLKDE
jgi:type II secretory pathway component GspD/PulD (secretin)